MKNILNVRMMVEAGVMMGLAYVLDSIRLFTLPQGGSITLGSMIPILIFAIRWGGKAGVITGLAFGLLQFLLGPKYSFHPISILCDYVVAWGFLGASGFFRGNFRKVMIGAIVGIFGRFVCHFISGITIWSSYAPEGTPVALYSLVYNGSYIALEGIIALVVLGLLYRPLKAYLAQ